MHVGTRALGDERHGPRGARVLASLVSPVSVVKRIVQDAHVVHVAVGGVDAAPGHEPKTRRLRGELESCARSVGVSEATVRTSRVSPALVLISSFLTSDFIHLAPFPLSPPRGGSCPSSSPSPKPPCPCVLTFSHGKRRSSATQAFARKVLAELSGHLLPQDCQEIRLPIPLSNLVGDCCWRRPRLCPDRQRQRLRQDYIR